MPYLCDQPLRDRMERRPILLEGLHSQPMRHRARHLENRATELHAALDDPRPVRPYDPLQGIRRVSLRCRRRCILQCHFVEPQSDLSVRAQGELVQAPEEVNV